MEVVTDLLGLVKKTVVKYMNPFTEIFRSENIIPERRT